MTEVRINEEAVRAKAYELWQLRGCPEGTEREDWTRAEQLLLEEASEQEQGADLGEDDAATLPTGMAVPPEVKRAGERALAQSSSPAKKRSRKRR